MKILAVLEDEKSIRVQSINGMLFVEEDWMKKKIKVKCLKEAIDYNTFFR